MEYSDFYKIENRINEQLKTLSLLKIDSTCEDVEKKLREMEREEYKEKFFKSMICNLNTCRYNQSGKCTNEEERKECIEVSKRVLCLEDRENEAI